MCLSTWWGFGLSFIFYKLGYNELTPVGSMGVENPILSVFLNGLFTSGSVWLIHNLEEMMERIGVNR